jgi:hypothetical protein
MIKVSQIAAALANAARPVQQALPVTDSRPVPTAHASPSAVMGGLFIALGLAPLFLRRCL